MALPRRTTGSLDPTFVPARPVCLAVNPAYALALHGGVPIPLSRALSASVTIWETTAPVKLPVWPCPPPRLGVQVRATELSGWYFTVASSPAETGDSKAPTYPTQTVPLIMTRVQLRCTGSFRLDAGIRRLHRNHKFAEPFAKTVVRSVRHSCRSELTRQGISLGFSLLCFQRSRTFSYTSCVHSGSYGSDFFHTLPVQVFSLTNQVQDLSEPREVDPLLRFQRMLLEEGNNPFVEVIEPPNAVCHTVVVIRSNHSTAEKFLQRVKQLNIPAMLDNGEFGEHLKLAGHLWTRIDADVETSFAVNESDYPLS